MADAKRNEDLKARIAELEDALARREAEWYDTVNALSDWACIIDLDFRIVRNNFDADFSHGLCPECAKKEYEEFDL
jgi:hypothetical protein